MLIPRVRVRSPFSATHSTIVLGVTGWLLGRRFRFQTALGRASNDIRMDSWFIKFSDSLFRRGCGETDILLWVSHCHGTFAWPRTKYTWTGICSDGCAIFYISHKKPNKNKTKESLVIWSLGIDCRKLTCSITSTMINITKLFSKNQIIFAFYWSPDLEDNWCELWCREEGTRQAVSM